MTEVIEEELRLMGVEITDQQDSLNHFSDIQGACVPQTAGVIPARIFGYWIAEQRAYLTYYEDLTGKPLWERLKRHTFDELHLIFGVVAFVCSAMAFWVAQFLASMFITLDYFWATWVISTLSVTLVLAISYPFSELRKEKKTYESIKVKARENLEQSVVRFGSEPMFLIRQIQIHVNREMKQYTSRLVDLEAMFKKAIIRPRRKLQKRIARCEADLEGLQRLDQDEDVSLLIDALQKRLADYREMLTSITPQEADLIGKFAEIRKRMASFQESINALEKMKVQYRDTNKILKRAVNYAKLGSGEAEGLLETRRSRELMEVENAINDLGNEITWTLTALADITSSMPAPDTYVLPSGDRPRPQ